MKLLPAPYNGGTRTVVLSSMQNDEDGQPELCNVMYWRTVESHRITNVELGQKRLTQTTIAPDPLGGSLTRVVPDVSVKSKFMIGNGVVYA